MVIPDQAYVYILASSFKKLYTGVTTRLMHRVADHNSGRNPDSFTSRYRIDRLVYYECYSSVLEAIARETQIKGWLRHKKIELIVRLNPDRSDLSLDWNEPIDPFDESKLRPPTKFNSPEE
jgi:putative endonuclease